MRDSMKKIVIAGKYNEKALHLFQQLCPSGFRCEIVGVPEDDELIAKMADEISKFADENARFANEITKYADENAQYADEILRLQKRIAELEAKQPNR